MIADNKARQEVRKSGATAAHLGFELTDNPYTYYKTREKHNDWKKGFKSVYIDQKRSGIIS